MVSLQGVRHSAVIALITVVATIAAGEMGVRVLDLPPRPIGVLQPGTYRLSADPVLRYEHIPNFGADQTPFSSGQRGYAFNSDGFRDREFGEKQPGTIRIVALGDSITAGYGIEDRERVYPSVLEKRLRAAFPAKRIEVFNLGVGGYDTLQEAVVLKNHVARLEPDIVTVGFCVNDFAIVDGGIYERLKAAGGAQWYRDSAGIYAFVKARSRLALFVGTRAEAILGGRRERPRFEYEFNGVRSARDDAPSAGLELVARLRERYDFEVFLFVVPHLRWAKGEYGPYFDRIHSRIEAIAGSLEIPAIDLLPDLKKRSVDGGELRSGSDPIHPSPAGHAAIAELIEATLRHQSKRLQ